MTIQKYTFLLLLVIGFASCEPYVEDKIDIGPPPNATFEIIQGETPNDFTLRNTTSDVFLTTWEIDGESRGEASEIDIFMPFAGTYNIIMTTFNRGGSGRAGKELVVTEDNPDACFGNMEILTGCSSKTWTLLQDEAALIVGPNETEVWWNNPASDVIDRACLFNDTYTFTAEGVYIYDNKGDFYADDDGSGNIYPPALGLTVGCQQSDAWPTDFSAWDSGTHAFEVTDNTLKVVGNGAFMGLYKVGDQQETQVPEDQITYTIDAISEDRLELSMFYGVGVWKMIFEPE